MYISQMERDLFDSLAKGWNTWDVKSVTAHIKLPEKVRLHIAFAVPHMSGYSGDVTWDNVEFFGEHSLNGSYTDVIVRYLGGLYQIESAADGETLLLRVRPLKPRHNSYIILEIGQVWGCKPFNIDFDGEQARVRQGVSSFLIDTPCKTISDIWNPSTTASIMLDGSETAYFRINSGKSQNEIDQYLAAAKEKWLESTITADGKLGQGLDAMRRVLLWNTIYDHRNDRVITPISRNWCTGNGRGFGDYVLFGWDTFFGAMQMGLINKQLAYANVFAILEEITPEGMIPNFGSANGQSRDRSEPQVGSLCVWKLFLQYGDIWFLEACFDRLLQWNRWRFSERDRNNDGLFELASTPWDISENEEIWGNHDAAFIKLGAALESGIDNSPMWDRVVFNEELHCHEMSYFGLCCEMVFDCEMLEKMAALLNRGTERAELSQRRIYLTECINTQLWDEERGFYMNKHWSGVFDECISLTGFYALTAGIASDERVQKIVNDYLINDNKFWGEYVLPNVSRDDPSFNDQEYWRGRIWAPTNYIVGEGLLRSGLKETRAKLNLKGLDLFVKCWNEKGTVGENYNAITGDAAEPDKHSDRFYHWGALLVYMAVESVVTLNAWTNQVERHSIPEWMDTTHISNLPLGEEKIYIQR